MAEAQLSEDQAISTLKGMSPDRQRAILARIPKDKKLKILERLKKPADLGGYAGLAEIGQGVIRGAKGIIQGGMEAMKPRNPDEVKYGPTGRLLLHTGQDIVSGLEKGKAARDTAAASGEGVPGQILVTAEQYPIIGPAVRYAESGGTQMFNPKSVGAAAEVATMVAAPKVAEEVIGGTADAAVSTVRKGAEAVKDGRLGLQRTAQAILDVGPELTERAVDEATKKYGEDIEKADTKQKSETERVTTGNRAKIEKYEDAKRQVFQDTEKQKAEHALATQEVAERNAGAQEFYTRRGQLARTLKEGSTKLGEGVKQLDAQVRKTGNDKYAEVRQKVANDEGEAPDEAIAAVKYAKKNILKGSAESIKQFTDLLRREPAPPPPGGIEAIRASSSPEAQAFAQKYDALADDIPEIEEAKPVKFDDWQGYSSEIGEKLAKGNLPGDIYQALKFVKETTDAMKAKIAARNGAAPLLKSADAFWRQYMETFYDKPSAVAATLDRVGKLDPDYYSEPFVRGKSASIGMDALRKYSPALADLAKSLRDQNEEFKSLSAKLKVEPPPKEPEPPENPSKPKLEAPKKIQQPEAPTVDVKQLKKDQLLKTAESFRRLNRYDAQRVMWSFLGPFMGRWEALLFEPAVLGGKMMMGKALQRPAAIEWLSKVQPEDVQAISRLPKNAQDVLNQNLKNVVEEERAHGNPIPVSKSIQEFFGWPLWTIRRPTAKELKEFGAKQGVGANPQPRKDETSGETQNK